LSYKPLTNLLVLNSGISDLEIESAKDTKALVPEEPAFSNE
jgi:hypothetical protein